MVERKLLYQMPEDIYRANRKSDLRIQYLAIPLYLVGIFGVVYMINVPRGHSPAIFLGSMILLASAFIFSELKYARLNRFEIYEDGFVPAVVPVSYALGIVRNKKFFIDFKEIDDIRYVQWGEVCVLTLNRGKKMNITTGWKDIEGYLEFSKVIKKYFPDKKYPNFDVVVERFNAWQAVLKKKQPKNERLATFDKMRKVNKEFGPKIG